MKKFICLFTGVLFLAGWVQVSGAQEEKSIDEIEENVNNMLQLLENLETQENGAEAANIPIPEETIPQETGESMGALLDAEAMPPEKPMPAAEPVPAEAPKQEMAEKKTMPAPAPEPVRKRIEESNEVVRFVPNDPDLLFRAGLDNWKSKKLGEAIEQFQEVVQLEPENAHAYWNLGLIHHQKGQGAEAVGYMKKAEDLYLKYNYFSYAEESRAHLDALIQKYQLDPKHYEMASN